MFTAGSWEMREPDMFRRETGESWVLESWDVSVCSFHRSGIVGASAVVNVKTPWTPPRSMTGLTERSTVEPATPGTLGRRVLDLDLGLEHSAWAKRSAHTSTIPQIRRKEERKKKKKTKDRGLPVTCIRIITWSVSTDEHFVKLS